MNAPKTPDAVLQLDAELVPVDVIIPSSTHIQTSRRKRFSDEAILELAASISTSGVINPILVRPFPEELKAHITPTPKYELVAGERRWLATKRAGLAHIPAVIRPLDDGQVLEAQLVENLQRENLNPLEEAEGYQELKALKGYDAQRIGDLIGKSKSYVLGRMKLNALAPKAKEALATGAIDFSKALLIARFSSTQLQEKALEIIEDEGGAELPYRDTFDTLRHDFMADLERAPFAFDDPHLFRFVKRSGKKGLEDAEALPACAGCAHNSANDPELQRDVASTQPRFGRGSAHVCTDKPCFEMKVVAFWERESTAAAKDGREVLVGKAAKAAIPPEWNNGYNVEHLDLDAASDLQFSEPAPKDENSPEWEAWNEREEKWRPPTWRELLGADTPVGILAQGEKGERHELIPTDVARKLLKPKGIKLSPARGSFQSEPTNDAERAEQLAQQKRDEEKRAVEREARRRVMREIFTKWKGPLKRPDLEAIAEFLVDGYPDDDGEMEELYDGDVQIGKMKDDELTRYIVLNLIADNCSVYNLSQKPEKLLEVAARLKIDTKAIRAQVVRDLKPTSAPAADAPTIDDKPVAKKTPAKKKAAKK